MESLSDPNRLLHEACVGQDSHRRKNGRRQTRTRSLHVWAGLRARLESTGADGSSHAKRQTCPNGLAHDGRRPCLPGPREREQDDQDFFFPVVLPSNVTNRANKSTRKDRHGIASSVCFRLGKVPESYFGRPMRLETPGQDCGGSSRGFAKSAPQRPGAQHHRALSICCSLRRAVAAATAPLTRRTSTIFYILPCCGASHLSRAAAPVL